METKQTAVEWLENALAKKLKQIVENRDYILIETLFESAKAMEKEQIKDAWKDSSLHRYVEEVLEYSAEEYYNETYLQDK